MKERALERFCDPEGAYWYEVWVSQYGPGVAVYKQPIASFTGEQFETDKELWEAETAWLKTLYPDTRLIDYEADFDGTAAEYLAKFPAFEQAIT